MTPEQVFLALGTAWQLLTGSPPDRKVLHILHAQSALETGHWKSVMNYNLGGAKKHGDNDWCYFTTTERLPHKAADKLIASAKPGEVTVLKQDDKFKTVRVSGKQSMNCFASWDDLDTAAKDHLALLFRRFPAAIEAAKKGDATGYVRELKKRGYFTASEEEYTKIVNSIARRYTRELQGVQLPGVIVL